MIEVKRVEIRDSATLIPAIALKITEGEQDGLLERAGFGGEDGHVILIHLESMKCQNDAFEWPNSSRTMHQAHRWLDFNWDKQDDGGVLDVEFILGERSTPKVSECESSSSYI